MKMILILTVIVFLNSCGMKDSNKDKETERVSKELAVPIKDRKAIDKLIDMAINKGDDKAYNEVASFYLIEDKGEDFLYTALTVANRYNNPEACYHIYIILNNERTGNSIDNLDPKTKKMALYYLLKSYEMGFKSAQYQVDEIFKTRKVIPKSEDFGNK